MSTKHTLKSEPRKITGRKIKSLRAQGLIPANVFGKDVKSQALQIKSTDFAKLYKEAGESTLIYLDDRPVMIHEVAVHPVTDKILHVDFHQVNLKEKTTANVAIKLVGVAPAEKEKQGILVQQLHELEIEALPADMPEAVEVSVASLTAEGDTILVKDLKLSDKLTVKIDPEAIVVKIEPLAKEEPKEVPVVPVVPEGEAAATEATPAQSAAPETPAPATPPPSQTA
ncbi:MAG: 50S ribosomal protein L25 [Candidatus Amesbacteria bacterium GW2011_GWA2_47_11b]|uniref:Large ribosomal subunit protein bL25 n=2 Tax=Candidatus Amesiibacteriota TaxID=1752730 RepID=A0A0G1TVB6_9BACT|nr:MAG: 50S ribosomal protein L25 [Microgenomates group bacterium GW2011_GWC1_46_20]KKU58078.1 MAG: 50S ribosomal protein L25 [Candidatus Amesbacteria bacterium GW2011_GWA2_47_11b]KKU83804.1 MAG: 50S ribosomal protein L25 [Candidatus Amesbacteria bacterium GW2011_GWC2_47_8]